VVADGGSRFHLSHSVLPKDGHIWEVAYVLVN